jgi:hypothetical protein
MTRTWTVRRQLSPRRDGERRWDQACQLLVGWARQHGLVVSHARLAQELTSSSEGPGRGVVGDEGPHGRLAVCWCQIAARAEVPHR